MGVERIVPSELDDDELWRRNDEYVSARDYDATVAELERLKQGEYVLVPISRNHAEAMLLVAESYLRDNPE